MYPLVKLLYFYCNREEKVELTFLSRMCLAQPQAPQLQAFEVFKLCCPCHSIQNYSACRGQIYKEYEKEFLEN